MADITSRQRLPDNEEKGFAPSQLPSEQGGTDTWPAVGGRLFFVDDKITVSLLARLLADESSRDILKKDKAFTYIHRAISDTSCIPRNLNTALVVTCLWYTKYDGALPFVSDKEGHVDQPVRVQGRIAAVERKYSDLLLRVEVQQTWPRTVIWLSNVTPCNWGPADLIDKWISAVGLLRRPRYRHVVAAGIMLRTARPA